MKHPTSSQQAANPTTLETGKEKEKEKSPSSDTTPTNLKAPKIIHFIWAGGAHLMPKENVLRILAWMKKNPDFCIWIWIDRHSGVMADPEQETKRQITHYKKFLSQVSKQYELKDITSEGLASKARNDDLACYEIDRLQPNYGASSDILRYRILHKFGGAYFDSDINPGENQLIECDIFENINQHCLLYVDHLSQMEDVTSEQLSTFKLKDLSNRSMVGNDALMSTPNNPLLLAFLNQVESNYRNAKLTKKIEMTYDAMNIMDRTIEFTGPALVRSLLDNPLNLPNRFEKQIILGKDSIIIKPIRCIDWQYCQPDLNTTNWLFTVPEDVSNERLTQKILNTIIFEVKELGILRLDDHISDYICILKKSYSEQNPALDENETAAQLIAAIENQAAITAEDYANVQVAQNKLGRPSIANFYQKVGLSEKTQLDKYPELVFSFSSSMGYLKKLLAVPSQDEMSLLELCIFKRHTKLPMIVEQILYPGLAAIEFMSQHAYITADSQCYIQALNTSEQFCNESYKFIGTAENEGDLTKGHAQTLRGVIDAYKERLLILSTEDPQEKLTAPRMGAS